MRTRRRAAPLGSYTPRVRIYQTIDLFAVDREYPIRCADPASLNVGDEIAFLRSDFTPVLVSTYLKDDLIEVTITGLTRGLVSLDYHFVNGKVVGLLHEGEAWKKMKPATLVKVWCKRRRRVGEDQTEEYLDPGAMPFAIELLEPPLDAPEPRYTVPEDLVRAIEDVRCVLGSEGTGDVPTDTITALLLALGPVSPTACLTGGHARRVALALTLTHRALDACGWNTTPEPIMRALSTALGCLPDDELTAEIARCVRLRAQRADAGANRSVRLNAAVAEGVANVEAWSAAQKDPVRVAAGATAAATLRAFVTDAIRETEGDLSGSIIVHALAAEVASRPDSPLFARRQFWEWLLNEGLPATARCITAPSIA